MGGIQDQDHCPPVQEVGAPWVAWDLRAPGISLPACPAYSGYLRAPLKPYSFSAWALKHWLNRWQVPWFIHVLPHLSNLSVPGAMGAVMEETEPALPSGAQSLMGEMGFTQTELWQDSVGAWMVLGQPQTEFGWNWVWEYCPEGAVSI